MPLSSPFYMPPNPSLWQGRKDSLPGERFFQQVQQVLPKDLKQLQRKHAIFLGFASDEGIMRNQGRAGAKFGPDALKKQLAKLPFHSQIPCADLGNVVCENQDLEGAQATFAHYIHECHKASHLTIGFGGGHEIAWAHFQGLAPHYPQLGIINIDAHFDLRPYNQVATSGTPFSQIAAFSQENNRIFYYCCLGIQPHSNTQSLLDRAKTLKVAYLTAEAMQTKTYASQRAFLAAFLEKHSHIYLSICLDAFASCYAPGVSAPQVLGLIPSQVLPLLKYLMQSGKVIGLDIAELSPPLDEGEKTANLAAILVAELLSNPNL